MHRKFSKMPPNLSLPFADQTFLFFSILHQVFFQKIVIQNLGFTSILHQVFFKNIYSKLSFLKKCCSKLTFLINIASGLLQNLLFSSILHQVFLKTDSKFNIYWIGKQNCHIVSAFQERHGERFFSHLKIQKYLEKFLFLFLKIPNYLKIFFTFPLQFL